MSVPAIKTIPTMLVEFKSVRSDVRGNLNIPLHYCQLQGMDRYQNLMVQYLPNVQATVCGIVKKKFKKGEKLSARNMNFI